MNENTENRDCNCLNKILCTIINLQKRSQILDDTLASCDKPFLGPCSNVCFNTRPITLYTCCNACQITMPYTINGETCTSSVFRVEAAEGCCCTCRVLAPNPDSDCNIPYVATDSFFTVNLNCIGAIRCLPDTFVNCI